MDLTLTGAIGSSREGHIDSWVDAFLLGPGNNEALAVGLKKAKRYWLGPLRIRVALLERCCGPESHMEYMEDAGLWQERLVGFRETLASGGEFPPLIAEYRDGKLSVRDGNHRLGAIEAEGHESTWALVWHNSKADLERHRKELGASGAR